MLEVMKILLLFSSDVCGVESDRNLCGLIIIKNIKKYLRRGFQTYTAASQLKRIICNNY
jgi:hypothetical protein